MWIFQTLSEKFRQTFSSKFNIRCQCPCATATQFWYVDAHVTIYHKHITLFGKNHILIVKVTQIDFGRRKSPIPRVYQLKT